MDTSQSMAGGTGDGGHRDGGFVHRLIRRLTWGLAGRHANPGGVSHRSDAPGKGHAPIATITGPFTHSIHHLDDGQNGGAWIDTVMDARTVAPVLFALALAAGAAVYFSWPVEPGWPLLMAGLGAASLACLLLYRIGRMDAAIAGGILLSAALGLVYAKAVAVTTDTVTVTGEMRPLQLEGWVRQVESGRNGPRLRIDVHAIQSMDADQTPRQVRVTHRLSLAVGPGRFVRCRVVLRPPPGPAMEGDYDFKRQAFFEGLGAVGYVQGRCRGGAVGAPPGLLPELSLWIDGQRRRLAHHVRTAAGSRAGGFAAALVSGDRSFIDPADQTALRASGLAHLLAISGLHLAIVCGLVYLIVRRGLALIEPVALRIPVQKPAALAALIAGGVYLILSGASVSTQRAFIMAAIFFGATLFDRAGFSLRAFAVAMVAVVIIDPVSVVAPGFQMSFAATGALIATYAALTRRRRAMPGPVTQNRLTTAAGSLVVTSLVASAATAPFAVYHFDRVAGAGLIANLLAMPIVSMASAPSAGLALILAPFGQADIGLKLFGLSLEAVLAVAHWAADLPGQSLTPAWPMPGLSFAGLILAVSAWIVLHGWARWAIAALWTGLAFALWSQMPGPDLHWGANGDLYVADRSGVSRIAVIDGDGLGPLRYSDLPVMGRCPSGLCTYRTHRGTVTIDWRDERPHLCVRPASDRAFKPVSSPTSTRSGNAPCAIDLSWDHIAGRSVTIDLSKPPPDLNVPCRPRPWLPC